MNKNALILFIIIGFITLISVLATHKREEIILQEANPSAIPANGLVTTEQPKQDVPVYTQTNQPADGAMVSPNVPTNAAPISDTPTNGGQIAQPTTAMPMSNGTDDVPATAEVAPAPATTTGPTVTAPATTAPANPTGVTVPPSEGQ